jgi:hypothetical protein
MLNIITSRYSYPTNAGVGKVQIVGPVNMMVQKTGYLYVYVSNETNMDVYFDDLVINHKTGPLLEVNNYRAFGSDIARQNARAFIANETNISTMAKSCKTKNGAMAAGWSNTIMEQGITMLG